jgi:hypothetical protein
VVLIIATLPGFSLPGAPSGASFIEDVSARGASLRGSVPTRALAPGGPGLAPRGPTPAPAPVPSSPLAAVFQPGVGHYSIILNCIN